MPRFFLAGRPVASESAQSSKSASKHKTPHSLLSKGRTCTRCFPACLARRSLWSAAAVSCSAGAGLLGTSRLTQLCHGVSPRHRRTHQHPFAASILFPVLLLHRFRDGESRRNSVGRHKVRPDWWLCSCDAAPAPGVAVTSGASLVFCMLPPRNMCVSCSLPLS